MPKAKPKEEFPLLVNVHICDRDEGKPIFCVSDDPYSSEVEDGEQVAVYELKLVKRKAVEHRLV